MEAGPTRPIEPFPAAVPFACTVEPGTCTAWVQPTGELDLLTAPVLEQHLREALAQAMLIILDLRQLSFMDASGLHVICAASEKADSEGRRLMIFVGPPRSTNYSPSPA